MTGNRKCLPPWEEVSNRTGSCFLFGGALPVGRWPHRRCQSRHPSSLGESQHCCCALGVHFLLLFYQICGAERRKKGRPKSVSLQNSPQLSARCAYANAPHCFFVAPTAPFQAVTELQLRGAAYNLRARPSEGFSSPRQCHV